jgi:hypothetical protein
MEMIYANLRLNRVRCCDMHVIKRLRQGKFMPTLWTLSHCALYGRWATRTSKRSTIRYVECKTAFRTFHYVFGLRIHSLSLSPIQPLSERLKTFLKMLPCLYIEVLTILTIKYCNIAHLAKDNCLGMKC